MLQEVVEKNKKINTQQPAAEKLIQILEKHAAVAKQTIRPAKLLHTLSLNTERGI